MSIQSLSQEDDHGRKTPDSLFSIESWEIASDNLSHLLEDHIETTPKEPPANYLWDHPAVKPASYFGTTLSIVPVFPVQGLYYLPNLIDDTTEQEWMTDLAYLNWSDNPANNQMMFFSRPTVTLANSSQEPMVSHSFLNWPTFLIGLINRLPGLLLTANPENLGGLNDLLIGPSKSTLPWQAIINLYRPGEGIEQHVDMIDRFDDVILGISLGSNTAMKFQPLGEENLNTNQELYLEQRSGYFLSHDARFNWTHGIEQNKLYDLVHDIPNNETRTIKRARTRISITIRRLKPEADLLKS
ncbi:hypothetical protein O181_066686 [Austropuccinia psidii MF-1]|uniref:Fe2OG dioxygenase domain-containing protein n=1 Tax=Austropuccinia psidii MF-1 TaxID=1389203 RepID=A0A9Q3EY58_9BASI|nr:hypothetical protein [Austropuccinia psidii MF-1]